MILSERRIRQIVREVLSEAMLPQFLPRRPGDSFEDEDEDEGMPSADQPPSRIRKSPMEKRAAKVASRVSSGRRGAPIGAVLDRIQFFTSDQGRMMWMQGARNEYEDMAGGGDGGGIRGEYYPDWRDSDFQYVIDAVESGGMRRNGWRDLGMRAGMTSMLRSLIREQLDLRHDRSGAAIAFFSPIPDYIVFVAYDVQSLNRALFGDIEKPTVYSTLYLYSTPSENCNGAFEISSAESKVQRRGWGTDVRLAALGTLVSIMPDRHSVTDASSAVWQSLIDKGMIVGEPLPNVCLGDEFEGVRGHAEEKLNMSYKLAKTLPAHVIDMLARGKTHRKQIEESDLLELAQDLLVGRAL